MNQEKNLIAFRPKSALREQFFKIADALGVTPSEFARRCVEAGIEPVTKEIAKERKKGLDRVNRGMIHTQNMGSEWESPVLMPAP